LQYRGLREEGIRHIVASGLFSIVVDTSG
jgi:hypothetical protein